MSKPYDPEFPDLSDLPNIVGCVNCTSKTSISFHLNKNPEDPKWICVACGNCSFAAPFEETIEKAVLRWNSQKGFGR